MPYPIKQGARFVMTNYTAALHKGFTREPTTIEATNLQTAANACGPCAPPWTETKKARFAARDRLLLELFEDGCSVAALERALDGRLGLDAIAVNLGKARRRGNGTGTRRFVARPTPIAPAPKPQLSPLDKQALQELFASLPQESGHRTRHGQKAASLQEALNTARNNGITLADLGNTLSISRQAVHQRLTSNPLAARPTRGRPALVNAN